MNPSALQITQMCKAIYWNNNDSELQIKTLLATDINYLFTAYNTSIIVTQ